MEQKISVIVPAYNLEQVLSRTLDAILAQTYHNLEVIVVDDGSADETGALIDAYAEKEPRIRAIHQKNGGVTCARLRGAAEATGQWIGFVDGDDELEPEMYERLLQNALTYEADISHCGYQMVFPDGHVDYYYNTGTLLVQEGSRGCRDLISGTIEPGLWNKLYRRELLEELLCDNQMPTDIKINEDVLMNFYLFEKSRRSVYEDVCLYHYMLRKGSAATSRLNAHKLEDPLRVTKLILQECEPAVWDAAYARLLRQLISGAAMTVDDQKELIKPYRDACRRELRQNIKKMLQSKCSIKLKVMALWTAIWPGSYGFVHRVYAHVTGLDKIYDLE